MICKREEGIKSFRKMELIALCKKDIHYALRILVNHDFVKSIKDNRKVTLFLSSDVTMNDVVFGNNYYVDNIVPPIKRLLPKTCPYKGRRYDDVPSKTYDAALADRQIPLRQYNYSIQGGSLAGDI